MNAINSSLQKDDRTQKIHEMKRLKSQKSLKKLENNEITPSRNDHNLKMTDLNHLPVDIDSSSYEI